MKLNRLPVGSQVVPVPLQDRLVIFVLLLFSSGNPGILIGDTPELTLVPAALLLLGALLFRANVRFDPRDGIVIAIFLLLTSVHLVTVPGATIIASLGFFVRLAIGYAAIRLVRDAPVTLIRVLTAVAALALGFFSLDRTLSIVGIDLAESLELLSLQHGDAGAVHVVFHNFNAPIDRYRNAGLYWEPGALSGYCLLAMLLLAFARERVSARRYRVSLAILTLAVLSTLSTTGYLLLPLTLLLHVLRAGSGRGGGVLTAKLGLALPVFAVIAFTAFELPFMRDKITEQIYSLQDERAEWQLTRIGTLIVDLQDIRDRPLAGWGANPRVRPSQEDLSEVAQVAQGNGFTNWWVRFGTIGLGLFLVSVGYGLRRYARASLVEALVALLILCALLQGEAFLNYPLFLGLMFLGAVSWVRRFTVVRSGVAAPRAENRHSAT